MKHIRFPKWQPSDDLPTLWLDATNTSTASLRDTAGAAITNGATVGHWTSQGSSALDFVQFATNARPTWTNNGINGLAAVRCVAAAFPNAQGLGVTSPAGFTSMSSMTVIVAQKVHLVFGGTATPFAFTTSHDTRSADETLLFMGGELAPREVSGRRVQAPAPDGRDFANGDNIAADIPQLLGGVFDWQNARISLYQNGKVRVLNGPFKDAGTTSANPPFGVAVGGFLQEASGGNVLASAYDGWIGEVLCWKNRAFTPDQMVAPHAYLAQKWNPGLPVQF